jgi:hypothetical protein
MTHGYSLRPNANGRRGRKSTDNPEDISSTSTSMEGQGEAHAIDESEGYLVESDEGPARPRALSLIHKKPAFPQDNEERRLEAWRQRGITSSTAMTMFRGPMRHLVGGETPESVQEDRRRVEMKHRVEAVRIQREQLERRYRQDLSGLHDRIAMLRQECEKEVARVRFRWERTRAIERGEAMEAEEEEEEEEGVEEEEGEEGEMECDEEEGQTELVSACAPTETWSLNDHDHDHDDEQRPAGTSQPWPHNHAGLSSNVPVPLFGDARRPMLAPPPLQRLRGSPLLMAGPSSLGRPEVIESGRPGTSHGLPPLRRQPAQLLPFSFAGGDSSTRESGDDDDDSRSEEDQDSEMGEA